MKAALDLAAVIFDLDGLVLDSESTYFRAWRFAAQQMGFCLSQGFCESLSGLPGPSIAQRLTEYCGKDFDIDFFFDASTQIWREQVKCSGLPIKPGFHSLLECLREAGLRFALATNSRRIDAEHCLACSGLEAVFSIMICRDDVVHPKPAADIYIKAADVLAVQCSRCLVLEDSPVGVAAAVAAGCPCIFVPSLLPADAKAVREAGYVMQDLAQVADFISAGSPHPL
ncbi:MAG: HAD family phosphatase [Methylomonas sp.]|nr:HAD family phosphatase [Methylomonas sp.]